MKTRLLFFAAAIVLMHTGCMKKDINSGTQSNQVSGPVFDFSTSATYTLNVKYDVPEGYIVGFSVYGEYPLQADADGNLKLKPGLIALDKGFTDRNGAYNKPVKFPSYIRKLYVYTTYAGVTPRLLETEIVNGQLMAAIPVKTGNSRPMSLATKAGGMANYNTRQTDFFQFNGLPRQTLTLGKWHTAKQGPNPTTLATGEQVKLLGRPVQMSYVDKNRFGDDAGTKDALIISADVLQTINTALRGDNSGIEVNPEFLKSGDIHITKPAELDLVFIQNWGAYRNVLAYYCYETDNAPRNIEDIKYQVIALPNAMEQKIDLQISSMYDIASMYKGEGVKLKYVDADGNLHDRFPAGTSVGWILYRDGYKYPGTYNPAISDIIDCVTAGEGANFSNPAFSASPNTAVLRHGDFVIVGFDDGDPAQTGYRDYLDVMFNVQSTPADAITGGIPDVDPEKPAPVDVTTMGILMFEDLWPYQGDFDMNDVVVKYVSQTKKNSDNAVVSAKVDYTVLHSGATYNNSFAYQDANIANAQISLTGGEGAGSPATIDRANNIVRLANNVLDYANKTEKVTFTVNYTFNSPVTSYQGAPFNPFITVGTAGTGKEVHLTNYPPTAAADASWFNMRTHDCSNPSLGLYYITFENYAAKSGEDKGQQLPFAVNVVFDSEEAMNGFKVTKEGKHIGKHYPEFKNWVGSNGKENPDWYLHFVE